MSVGTPLPDLAPDAPGAASAPDLHLLYGGTFDPIHLGHLAVARAALARTGATRLDFVPAADPPHRAAPGAGFEDRLALIEAALVAEPRPPSGIWGIDPREGHRAGPSFTVDTLREWREEHGHAAPLGFVLGADAFLNLPAWRDWAELFALAHLVVACRQGHVFGGPDGGSPDSRWSAALAAATAGRWRSDPASLRAAPAGRILRLDLPLQPESASAVRRDVAAGVAAEGLPAAVAALVQARHLYR